MSEVIDLSDLVQSVKFKFNDQEFEIPPIPDDKLKGIMSIANKITETSKEGKKGSVADGDNEEFISNHNKFLAMAIQKKDGDKYIKMEPDGFSEWPLKLKNKVMELVFEQIGTSSGDDIPADSEKN